MTRYTEIKAQANKVMLAGIGGGCLLFAIGTLSKLPPLSVFGLLAGAGAGGFGYVMRENAKGQRNEDEVYEDKRKELENFLDNAKQRANQTYRLDYFDLDRNKSDFINFNAYELTLSDRITKATGFSFVEQQKLYQTRTRREVDRVTKKKVYYKEWQETYVAQVIIAIHYHNSVINARVSAAQYDSLVSEYNQLETRRNSVANLEYEYEQLLARKIQNFSKTSNPNPQNRAITVNQNPVASNRRDLSQIDKGYRLANKYEVIQKLGEGGFGATFIVKSLTANIVTQFVAKCQKLTGNAQQDRDLIERFEKEAIALQRIGSSHGQVPSLFDYFDYEGNFYLIQELVRGQTLMNAFIGLAEEGYVFSERKAVEIIASLLEILEHIHEQGLIHRDIKPDNIILREGDGKPVLIDFGLIKQLTQDNCQQTGTVAGTIGYCPIEQQLGKAFFQSDLYAVGMVMLLLTTGRPPHTLDFNDQFEPDLEWAKPAINPSLFNWIAKAIRPLPQSRFASAFEMREALLELLNQEYFVRGVRMADETYQKQIASMEAEIENLLGQLDDTSGQAKPKVKKPIPCSLGQIITTQKELDACNIVKRIVQNAGYDSEMIQLTDAVDYCDIHLRDRLELILIKLYFNDESNLAFVIPQADGTEECYPINTLRGLSAKKQAILDRLEVLLAQTNTLSYRQQTTHQPSFNSNDSKIDEILRREILPVILNAIEDRFGSDFEIISLNIDEETSRFYGQFAGLNNQSGRKFDYELSQNSKGEWMLQYRPSEESLKAAQEENITRIEEEDKLARQGIYTPEWLQRNFDSFKGAKEHFGMAAKSWQKLAEKLNEKT